MDTFEWIAVVAAVGILGFLWSLHRDMRQQSERLHSEVSKLADRVSSDMRQLSERVSRLEGLMEGLRDSITGRDQAR